MELEQYIRKHKENKVRSSSFVDYLYSLMDKYGFSKASDLYNKAGVSRQLWSSMVSEKSNPSLSVCIRLVFAMGITNEECKLLLKKASYTLSSASTYALIIRYFLENGIYDLAKLNAVLEEYGYTDSLIY